MIRYRDQGILYKVVFKRKKKIVKQEEIRDRRTREKIKLREIESKVDLKSVEIVEKGSDKR